LARSASGGVSSVTEPGVYRQAVPSFVSPADAVAVSKRPMDRAQRTTLASIVVLLLVLALTMIVLVRAR
jgi:hypothetical protein